MKPALWCVHIHGPDDIHPAPNWAAAMEAAAWHSHWYKKEREQQGADWPVITFEVVPWPYSAESHAAGLKDWPDVWPNIAKSGAP